MYCITRDKRTPSRTQFQSPVAMVLHGSTFTAGNVCISPQGIYVICEPILARPVFVLRTECSSCDRFFCRSVGREFRACKTSTNISSYIYGSPSKTACLMFPCATIVTRARSTDVPHAQQLLLLTSLPFYSLTSMLMA